MATKTPNLKLKKPGKGEYVNTWHEPMNDNADIIDENVQALRDDVDAAAHSAASLAEFLDAGHDPDGNLLPTPEVVAARASQTLGLNDLLGARLDATDLDLYTARELAATLREALAFRELDVPSRIISGTKDSNGYPTWMGYTAGTVFIHGEVTPIVMMIDGKLCKIRTQKSVALSGADGTYYVYADFQANGVVTVDATADVPLHGVASVDVDGDFRLFTDNNPPTSRDFTALDVQVGDILDIQIPSGPATDFGKYYISAVAPTATNNLLIKGLFPVLGPLSAIGYQIKDPYAVTLGFASVGTYSQVAGRLIIAEVDLVSSNVTAIRPRHFGNMFVGEWVAVDVSSTPTFSQTWNHRLGSNILDISIQASNQITPTNRDANPIEELSLADLKYSSSFTPSNGTLAGTIGTLAPTTGTLAVSNVSLSSGDQTVSVQPALTGIPGLTGAPGLSGTVGGSVTTSVQPTRSVACQWDKNTISVKNLVNNLFFKDYSGTENNKGYIRVIVRKRS